MKKLAFIPLLLASATPVHADEWMAPDQWSLGWLGNVCSSFEVDDKLICGAYLQGVFAGQDAEANAPNRPDPKLVRAFCRPDGLTIEKMTRLISEHALGQPNAHSKSAHVAIAQYFAEIWPCQI